MGNAREIPEKPFYKIGEVCQFTDTQPYVIRFWESEFPQLSPGKGRSGQRVYRREDIDLILRIKRLLYEEEYTIAGARRALDEESVEPARAPKKRSAPRPSPPPPKREPEAPPAARVSVVPDESKSLRSRLAEVERDRERATAQVEELVRELDRLRDGKGGTASDLDRARVVAAEAAREAAERALRIQRQKAVEVAQMLEDLAARLDALDRGPGGDESAS